MGILPMIRGTGILPMCSLFRGTGILPVIPATAIAPAVRHSTFAIKFRCGHYTPAQPPKKAPFSNFRPKSNKTKQKQTPTPLLFVIYPAGV